MAKRFDIIFLGGGLAALMLLKHLKGSLGHASVCIIDPKTPDERSLTHWSYWSQNETYYDQFAIGRWKIARSRGGTSERLDPYELRLVTSKDVLGHLWEEVAMPNISWVRTTAKQVTLHDDLHEVDVGTETFAGTWLFDSAVSMPPIFPDTGKPHAILSGNGIRVIADRLVFKKETADLFEPLDGGGLVYTLPLSANEALVESARFSRSMLTDSIEPLLSHLRTVYPRTGFTVTHREFGAIPLGYAPSASLGPRHIFIGTKRGLVKPSAGFGIMRILKESERIARLFDAGKPIPADYRVKYPWNLMDKTFLSITLQSPQHARQLIDKSFTLLPMRQNLELLDENLPFFTTSLFMMKTLPLVLKTLGGLKYGTMGR